MAKKVVATIQKDKGKKFVKAIKMVKNDKGNYEFKESFILTDDLEDFLLKTMTQIKEKLYVITRNDLPYGSQAVQAGHSLAQFILEHLEISQLWHIIYLSVEDEDALLRLIEKCSKKGLRVSIFREPDLNNEITSITIEPGKKSKRLVGHLPLLKKKE